MNYSTNRVEISYFIELPQSNFPDYTNSPNFPDLGHFPGISRFPEIPEKWCPGNWSPPDSQKQEQKSKLNIIIIIIIINIFNVA